MNAASAYAKVLESSSSDLYHKGYDDASSGEEIDGELASLSDSYRNGFQQGLIYKTPVTSSLAITGKSVV